MPISHKDQTIVKPQEQETIRWTLALPSNQIRISSPLHHLRHHQLVVCLSPVCDTVLCRNRVALQQWTLWMTAVPTIPLGRCQPHACTNTYRPICIQVLGHIRITCCPSSWQAEIASGLHLMQYRLFVAGAHSQRDTSLPCRAVTLDLIFSRCDSFWAAAALTLKARPDDVR